jgi:hypothetical protein
VTSAGQTHEQWVKSMHRALTQSTEPELKLIEGEVVEPLAIEQKKRNGGT